MFVFYTNKKLFKSNIFACKLFKITPNIKSMIKNIENIGLKEDFELNYIPCYWKKKNRF